MAQPLKNTIHDKIRENESMTDGELAKALIKDGITIADDRFNKLLLDLEILGMIKVTWLTKDTRRIEIVAQNRDSKDAVDAQNRDATERDYEASFPGT